MKKSEKIILLANVFMKNLNDVDEDLIDQLLVQEGFNINELNPTIEKHIAKYSKKQNSKFKKGEKVEYIGKGFLGYDPKDNQMEFLEYDKLSLYDCWVIYCDTIMLVRDSEIKKLKDE